MIIDIHAHVFARPMVNNLATGNGLFMSAQDQIAVMDAKGIDKAVILPINNAECLCEMQSLGEVLTICESYPDRFIPFCNLDPRIPRRPDLITKQDYLGRLQEYRELGCKGLGELVARLPFDHPIMLSFFEACEQVGFPVTFHTITEDVNSYGIIDEMGLPRFENVLQHCPNLKFFCHSPGFWSEISGDMTAEEKNGYPRRPVAPGGRLIELMRRYPNVYGDLSAGSGLNALKRDKDHACRFLDEFQDRVLMGLDYCNTANDMQHVEWLTALCDQGGISKTVLDKVLGGNAARILGLE